MKVIFVCHTEHDPDKQSFEHLPLLNDFVRGLSIPLTFSLMVGGQIGGGLLRFVESQKIKIPDNCEKSIHLHQKELAGERANLSEAEISSYFQIFERTLGQKAKSVVFGKWQIMAGQLALLSQLGIQNEGSWIPKMHGEQYIIKPPFQLNGILEVPPAADGQDPLNPFTRLSHFFFLRKLIKQYHQRNLVLHIAFHSYDLFSFRERPKMRAIKRCLFKNILKLVRKHHLEILNLSDIKDTDFERLDKVGWPFLSKMFRIIRH